MSTAKKNHARYKFIKVLFSAVLQTTDVFLCQEATRLDVRFPGVWYVCMLCAKKKLQIYNILILIPIMQNTNVVSI